MLMTFLLAGCAGSTPPAAIERPILPALPASCARAPVPPVIVGEALPLFALKNRRALLLANAAIDNCRAAYEGIRNEFGG